MNRARLKSRVELQAKQATKNALNQTELNWQLVGEYWAEIKPLRSDERIAAQAQQASITHEVRIIYRTGVKASMRFVRGSRAFEIVGAPINEREENRYLLCLCEEKAI